MSGLFIPHELEPLDGIHRRRIRSDQDFYWKGELFKDPSVPLHIVEALRADASGQGPDGVRPEPSNLERAGRSPRALDAEAAQERRRGRRPWLAMTMGSKLRA